ncbi:PTS fructose transporter subunit IIA [bacterium]|nr:PTS fructose transporter subunit IIA [bacterium]
MIQIIITTHGHLAMELVTTTELIVGKQASLVPVCLEMHEGIEDLVGKLEAVILPAQQEGEETLLLVDMFGGTPSNVALALSEKWNFTVVTGVNLPMLIEAVTHRSLMSLGQLTAFVNEKGKKAILVANELLK